MNYIAWFGSLCFALCALPQAWQSFSDGHSNGVTWGLLTLWLAGEICTLIYVGPKRDWPLIFNYVSNIIVLCVIIWYKIIGG